MEFHWENGFTLRVSAADGTATVSANREGLVSLANHLLSLAQESAGSHFHLDANNALEPGSAELIVEKVQ